MAGVVQEVKKALTAKEAEHMDLQQQCQRQGLGANELEEEFKQKLGEMRTELENSKCDNDEKVKKNQELQQRITALDEQLEDLNHDLLQKEKEMNQSNGEIKDLRGKLQHEAARYIALRQSGDKLQRTESDKLRNIQHESSQKLKEVEISLTEARHTISETDERIKRLQTELNQSKSDNDTKGKRNQELHQKLENVKKALLLKEQEAKRKNDQIEDLRKQLKNEEEQQIAVKATRDTLQIQLEDVQRHTADLNDKLIEKEQEMRWSAEIDKISLELKDINTNVENEEHLEEGHDKALQRVVEERDEAKVSLYVKEKECNLLKRQIGEMNQELESVRNSLEHAEERFSAVAELRMQNEKLQALINGSDGSSSEYESSVDTTDTTGNDSK